MSSSDEASPAHSNPSDQRTADNMHQVGVAVSSHGDPSSIQTQAHENEGSIETGTRYIQIKEVGKALTEASRRMSEIRISLGEAMAALNLAEAEIISKLETTLLEVTDQLDCKALEEHRETCLICHEEYPSGTEDGQAVLRIPSCKHKYHISCLLTWFTTATWTQDKHCPLCQVKVFEIPTTYFNQLHQAYEVVNDEMNIFREGQRALSDAFKNTLQLSDHLD